MGGPATVIFRSLGSRESRANAVASSPILSRVVDRSTPIDAAGLASWVVGWPPTEPRRTLYDGVEATLVPGAHGSSAGASAHTDPGAPAPSLADAPRFLRRALTDAVDVAMNGVRRAAVLTGGGLDSSVLMGLASEWASRTGGTAFAVSLDYEAEGDDRPHMRALERHLGCEVIRVKPEDAAPRVALLEAGADAGPAASSTLPMEIEMLVRARENGAEIVLGGAGGDELFGGVPSALSHLTLDGHPLRAASAARRLTGFTRPRHPAWSWAFRPLLGRWIPESIRAWRGRRYAQVPSLPWAGPVVRDYLSQMRQLAGERNRRPPRSGADRVAALWDEGHQVLVASGRQVEEHESGMDCWYPYFDLDLGAAVSVLPPHYLLHGDRWRGLLREAARGLVPDSLRERVDKAAFEPAMQRWMDAAGGLASLRPLSSGRELAALGLVEPVAFAAAFEEFVRHPEHGPSWVSLYAALAVEAFLRGRAA